MCADVTPRIKGGWLDSVGPGYSRFAAAFAAAGYQRVEDLKVARPSPQQVESLLAGMTAAKSPQIEHLARALAALAAPSGADGSAAAAAAAASGAPKPLPASATAAPAKVAAGVHTPHKYLPAATYTRHTDAPPSSSDDAAERPSRRSESNGDRSSNNAGLQAHAPSNAASSVPPRPAVGTIRTAPPTSLQGEHRVSVLPNGKHAFLSYQWDVQEQVKTIKGLLNDRNVKCWMDIDGGMKSDIYDSMAEGVQGAACVVCFMTQAYQDSANCKLELKFAQQSGVPIIPAMMERAYSAKGWLGILTAGSIWIEMFEKAAVAEGVDKVIGQMQQYFPEMRHTAAPSSDASSASGPASIVAWGNAMFSLAEMRDELERLRNEAGFANKAFGGAGAGAGSISNESDSHLCPLPALVPVLPPGLFVTSAMEGVLAAVLSVSDAASSKQVGFCGMGGIGKTTVSTWVVRNEAVRAQFGMVAWISLGQTPVLSSCTNLLYLQLTGSELGTIPKEQRQERLKQAFLNHSVLLVLDDCWGAEVAQLFDWIDPNTNSKILISSRVRDVLDGGQIIDITVPSESDAVKMLLGAAGLDVAALESRHEVVQVADMCKRLPLTIGVASV